MTVRLPVIEPQPYPAGDVPGLHAEIRALAKEHDAIILEDVENCRKRVRVTRRIE